MQAATPVNFGVPAPINLSFHLPHETFECKKKTSPTHRIIEEMVRVQKWRPHSPTDGCLSSPEDIFKKRYHAESTSSSSTPTSGGRGLTPESAGSFRTIH